MRKLHPEDVGSMDRRHITETPLAQSKLHVGLDPIADIRDIARLITLWWDDVDADYLQNVGGGEPEFIKKTKDLKTRYGV